MGHSVCVFLTNFFPYLYFPITQSFTESDIAPFVSQLTPSIPKIEIVSCEISRNVTPLMYYRNFSEEDASRYSSFLKISVREPVQVGRLAKIMEGADQLDGIKEWFRDGKLYDVTAYEWNLGAEMRVMVDRDIVCDPPLSGTPAAA